MAYDISTQGTVLTAYNTYTGNSFGLIFDHSYTTGWDSYVLSWATIGGVSKLLLSDGSGVVRYADPDDQNGTNSTGVLSCGEYNGYPMFVLGTSRYWSNTN